MSSLLEAQQLLIAGMSADPVLCLANTVAWLDPFWEVFADADDYGEDGDTLSLALRVVRDSFPDIYVQVIEQLRSGSSWDEIERLVCSEIEKLGIPLDNLEFMPYGIPMPAYGVTLEDPEFYQSHEDVVPVVQVFGIDPTAHPYQVEVPECAHTAGQHIAASLEDHPDEGYRNLSWLMQWLFSCSGNSTIDFDYEAMCEFQPLSWERENIDFAAAIIHEADEIIGHALGGLKFLQTHHGVLTALRDNVQRIYKAISKLSKEKRHDNPRIRCVWPSIGSGIDRTTLACA
ncbi:hypothetical protein QPK87_28830 [Kamptonema cortianum]|jgi:hypothetical protein|nr:hypothetical protein [Kamptonema cortianum]